MKKMICGAIAFCLAGCYAPLNNSGVSTTKPWIEVPAKRVDFDGKQYDSCVQFKLHVWPQEAADRLDLQESCISACCWRSEKDEITLDFNQHFDEELRTYGVARKYSPEKIILKVTHSNLVNVTKVTATPRGAVKNSGLIKLSYTTVRDVARLAQIERELALQEEMDEPQPSTPTKLKPQRAPRAKSGQSAAQNVGLLRARALVQRKVGAQIDNYFYQMNKTYQAQGAVFILSTRLLVPQLQIDGTYRITCHAKARTGVDEKHLNASDFPCGVWITDLATQLVLPDDKKARQILGNP